MRFCIIGAGSGGRAFAAYISSKGHHVTIYNRSYFRISKIRQKGGIKVKGEIKGFFSINAAIQNLELAIKKADVIMVVIPASAHNEIARKIAPYITKDQIILLNPGRTFGSVEFLRIIEEEKGKFPVFIGETQTLLFTSRKLKGNKVNIIRIKDSVKFSTFPEEHTFYVYDTLKDIFPQLKPVDDYLEVTLNNIGMLLHPTLSLMNAGAMDFGRKFKFYREGATPQVCEVLEHVELEINQIFEKLGLKQFRYCKWAKECYGIDTNSVYDAIQNVEAYRNINAPTQLITRYFTEDVPTGLVPMSALAKFLGVPTPVIDSIITLSSILCGIDFRKTGRTIDNLNLEDFIIKRLKHIGILEENLMEVNNINV